MLEADRLKHILDGFRPLPERTVQSLQNSLLMRYNQESNAIEGNSLTLVETKVLLEQGVTAKGKPFKDHLDVINHQEAIYYLMDLVKNKEPLSERIIKDFNSLLLKGTKDEREAGVYRTVPVTLEGSEHIPPQPYLLQKKMEDLIISNDDRTDPDIMHPIERIARLHADFVGIHPFVDGNGRTGRLIMNLELLKNGYPLAVISVNDRADYYQALSQADHGNYQAIENVIHNAVCKTLTWELDVVHPDWRDELSVKPDEPDIELDL